MIKTLFFSFIGFVLLVAGVVTVDYARPGNARIRHLEWAQEQAMPQPTDTMLWAAAAAAVFGFLLLMLSFRSRRRAE